MLLEGESGADHQAKNPEFAENPPGRDYKRWSSMLDGFGGQIHIFRKNRADWKWKSSRRELVLSIVALENYVYRRGNCSPLEVSFLSFPPQSSSFGTHLNGRICKSLCLMFRIIRWLAASRKRTRQHSLAGLSPLKTKKGKRVRKGRSHLQPPR